MSSVPASSIGTFSVLPLVLTASISSAGILRLDGGDEGVAIDREAAARRGGAEPDLHGLRSGAAGVDGQGRGEGRAGEEVSAERHGMISGNRCSDGLRP